MNRREFGVSVGVGALATGVGAGFAANPAWAQGAPVEGTHYVRLQQAATVSAPAGKIEVVEFFSYGCPHCHAFEPALEEWVGRLPKEVAFRRVPVAFNASFEAYQPLFYGLEAMGKLEQMHKRIFAAIHVQRQRLEKAAEQIAFLNANGVDGAQFAKVSKEFHVVTKSLQAKKLTEAYKIDGVPALGIQGRYYTAGSLAGDNSRALAVADYLIARVKKA